MSRKDKLALTGTVKNGLKKEFILLIGSAINFFSETRKCDSHIGRKKKVDNCMSGLSR